MKKITTLRLLRTIALVLLLVGAIGSLYFVLYTGRNNKSVLLVALFVIWVISPFMALLVLHVVCKSWSVLNRVTLYVLLIIVTLGSLVSYSGTFSPPDAKPAAVFLIVPLISWLLMAIFISIVSLSRRLSRRNDGG